MINKGNGKFERSILGWVGQTSYSSFWSVQLTAFFQLIEMLLRGFARSVQKTFFTSLKFSFDFRICSQKERSTMSTEEAPDVEASDVPKEEAPAAQPETELLRGSHHFHHLLERIE